MSLFSGVIVHALIFLCGWEGPHCAVITIHIARNVKIFTQGQRVYASFIANFPSLLSWLVVLKLFSIVILQPVHRHKNWFRIGAKHSH